MAQTRRARTVWIGSLKGEGQVSGTTTGAFKELPVSWAARAEQQVAGVTSPEELLAAAHSSCFSMALAGDLSRAGATVDRLEVGCAVSFDKGEAGYLVTSSVLEVSGQVTGIDEDGFRKAADAAARSCPISKALAGVKIEVHANLVSTAGQAPTVPH